MKSKRFKIEKSKFVKDGYVIVDSDDFFKFPHEMVDKDKLLKYVTVLNYLDADLSRYKSKNRELKRNNELLNQKFDVLRGNENKRFKLIDSDEIMDTLVDTDTVWCFDPEEAERCLEWLNELNDLLIQYKQKCTDYEKCYDDIGDLLELYNVLTDFMNVLNELQSYFPKGRDWSGLVGDDWSDLCRLVFKSRDMLQNMDRDLIVR